MFGDQSSVVRIAQEMHPSPHCPRSTALGRVPSVATRGPQNTPIQVEGAPGGEVTPPQPAARFQEGRSEGALKRGEMKQKREREMKRDRKREFVLISAHLTPSHPELSSPALHLPDRTSQLPAAAKGSRPPPTHAHHVLCSKQQRLRTGFERIAWQPRRACRTPRTNLPAWQEPPR